MNHAPSSQDFRIGIEAAAESLQSNTAFAFLQRIQNHRQQQQLSENDLDDSAACVTELDSGAFFTVMTCALRTGDCDIVQRTFDELKATVGPANIEYKGWILLLQVHAPMLTNCFGLRAYVCDAVKQKFDPKSGACGAGEPQALRCHHCGNGGAIFARYLSSCVHKPTPTIRNHAHCTAWCAPVFSFQFATATKLSSSTC